MSRPAIGICTSFEPVRFGAWHQLAAFTPAGYVAAVQRAGGLALLLPPDPEPHPDEVLDHLDGLILAGGVDVDPASYGAEPHPETAGWVPERDAFELALASRALERDLPLLGICRGMQMLNVARGGSLLQHVPDLVAHEEHRRNVGTFEGNQHGVVLRAGSLAARAAGEDEHLTYSHHQAIDRLGDGLVVTGHGVGDELAEAVEDPTRRFVLGVQWHPEADAESGVIAALVGRREGERGLASSPARFD